MRNQGGAGGAGGGGGGGGGGWESSEEKVHRLQEKCTLKERRTMAGKGQSQLRHPWELDLELEGAPAAQAAEAGPSTCSPSRSSNRVQVIHSGHFMVSSPHSDSERRRRESGESLRYDFDTVNRTWCQTYRYGPLSSGSLSIDPTLTRLFECMSLAYSGKIVSPKWKSFKGLRLLWRDKIRINNAIWRGWYIQYGERKKSSVCGFVTPLEGTEGDAHRKPQTIVLEGSYWKRRIEVVIREYHKWRIYYKKRLEKKKDDILSMLQEDQMCQSKLEKWNNQMHQEPEAAPVEAHMFDLDCLLSDISDTLFTMTQKPGSWASDQHDNYTSNADIIQPGLSPLQPDLDEFMDIPDIFMNCTDQPMEQTDFADCGYFQSSSSTAFAPVPSPVVTAPQLLMDSQLAQPNLSSDSLPQLSSSNTQPEQTRPGQDCSEYHTSSMGSQAMSYGHQLYPDAPATIAFNTSIQQPATASIPFLHQPSHYPTTSVTSSVITHTASTMGAQGFVQQGHGFTYAQTPCHSLGYPANMSDPIQVTLPSVVPAHCFSVPKQVAVPGVRGKHKKKTGGARTDSPSVAPSGSQFIAPKPPSCLAELLCGTQERQPLVVTAKGQRSSSPSSTQSSSSAHVGGAAAQLPHGAGWPAGMYVLTPMHGESATMGHSSPQPSTSRGLGVSTLLAHGSATMGHSSPQPSTSRGLGVSTLLAHGSATMGHSSPQPSTSRGLGVSTLLTHGSAHTGPNVLIPKNEKLSPVQLYSTDRSSLSEHPGRTSTPNPLEIVSNPESPQSVHGKKESSKMCCLQQTETRRVTHISAEQKRRFNIKTGFDTLHNLVTTLSSQPSIKISNATTLQKTGEYITKMQQERTQLQEEAQKLREEVQLLNSAINECQMQLPATGVPITRQRFDHMRQKFREYVRVQTLQNWKFWIFGFIIEPLFESYNSMVSTASVEDLCRTTMSWLDQHCSLLALRPMVLTSLRHLSTSTAILTDPRVLPEQATLAVTQGDPPAPPDDSLQPPTWDNVHHM
ncbi:carbohydrate-responsive element-binding protein-like isoform X3 [Hippoglossus hippoglossus]|uniref:carbohydrate-responsive element-binding protein-like isoform X3 n=1 Tax=Hippoglossus hippoglossus TaxID=8267 RepID=UPI00148E4818|nr:carbohydrate-responsive element-binding protein-like isoform X3 [Hippoglossus hippoglossus]